MKGEVIVKEKVKQQLEQAGINVEAMLQRLMGNEIFVEKLLKKFLEDSNYQKLKEAFEQKDYEKAYQAAHALKGVSANMSMILLNGLMVKQTELLRQKQWNDAELMIPYIAKEYMRISDVIKEYVE